MTDAELDEVIVRVEGAVGRLTLNRPRALNALTTRMCTLISDALLKWESDPAVRLVLIDHAGERGFCAGGDIRLIQQSGAGDGVEARAFFAAEYRMNDLLHRYAKPTVVIMDGLTLGGGVGVSAPCRHRVATERTAWAMPEGDIGLYPDVGAGWYLPRLPGHVGAYLALTGARMKGGDCLHLRLATSYTPSDKVEAMKAALVESGDLTVIDRFAEEPGPAAVDAQRADIDRLFSADAVEAIEAALAADGGDWASAQLATMRKKCPTTQKVSLRLIEAGARRPSFTDEMAAEYRVSCRMVHRHDFIEGVRALIIDKDNSPRWEPATLAEVTDLMLDEIFAELPSDEEWTPLLDAPTAS